MKGYLVLENGEIFEGERFGSNIDATCEIVFNTGMAGYIETFTDPSYYGQGIVMTYPLIGNYGVIDEDEESFRVWAKAVIIHELANVESNFRSTMDLDSFLKNSKTPGLKGVNTRKLTRLLRSNGTMKGKIVSDISNIDEILEEIKEYKIENAVEKVSRKQQITYGSGKAKQIALIDYGSKDNIVNSLLRRGVSVAVYPAKTEATMILANRPDGILLSNGPRKSRRLCR